MTEPGSNPNLPAQPGQTEPGLLFNPFAEVDPMAMNVPELEEAMRILAAGYAMLRNIHEARTGYDVPDDQRLPYEPTPRPALTEDADGYPTVQRTPEELTAAAAQTAIGGGGAHDHPLAHYFPQRGVVIEGRGTLAQPAGPSGALDGPTTTQQVYQPGRHVSGQHRAVGGTVDTAGLVDGVMARLAAAGVPAESLRPDPAQIALRQAAAAGHTGYQLPPEAAYPAAGAPPAEGAPATDQPATGGTASRLFSGLAAARRQLADEGVVRQSAPAAPEVRVPIMGGDLLDRHDTLTVQLVQAQTAPLAALGLDSEEARRAYIKSIQGNLSQIAGQIHDAGLTIRQQPQTPMGPSGLPRRRVT